MLHVILLFVKKNLKLSYFFKSAKVQLGRMVSDTRSARNSKDEGRVRSSKKKTDSRKDSSRRSPGKDLASGVRRSARETSESIHKTPSPQSKRKSKRLEKGPPPLSPTMKRKSERLEKHIAPSPVRRSDRGKKVFSTSSSGSKKSAKELSLSEWKRKKEKNVIQVTMESEKAELDREAVGMKRKNMNARSFMALFKRQCVKIVPDGAGVLEGRNKVSDCSDNSRGVASDPINGEGISDECSRRMVGELRDVSIGIDKASDGAHQKSNYSSEDCHADIENKINMDSSRKDNCSSIVNMDAPESESSTCLAKAGDGSLCFDVGEKCVRSKVAGATLSSSPKCENRDLLGTCVMCSKNKRVVYSSWEQELCSCSFTVDDDLASFSTCKGRSVHEAAVTSETAEKCDSRHLLAKISADSQMGGHENVCAVCNKSGKLLCCEGKGCKRFYHLCCLDPPQTDDFPGVWHCPHCVKKKLLFGVHSVSEGVESIWDVREVEVSNVKGVRQRQYLVKYKGLAHIHNHWLPEKQLLLEKSCLVSDFIEKDQIVRWSAEWTVPHRLLRKRSIKDNIYIASSSVISVCNYEWLVKWHGLGYDHATWELDNADCLSSPLGQNLIKDYETRCERAKQEANLHHQGSIVKLSELPPGQSLVNDKYVLKNVNKLRECVFKCQNAVVFDDQERATTIMFFLRSMSEICRPFLIVTASSSLSQWEAEFARLVPSVDVVVYSGNKDTRKGVRASEFYDEGGHLMLQVLLSSVEAVFEDLDRLISIKWEAVVVDDYQQFGISHDHEQIKMLPTDSRILLVSGQIKDTSSEYLRMLSLLESHGDLDKWKGLKFDTNDHLCRLKNRFSRFIAYGSNSQLSKFLEYWVPVQISNYQLEHYCATVLDNSVHLCSCSRTDSVGALRDILLTVRKCCDHPYLLDSSVQGRMFAEKRPVAEILEFGIKASGKLELLDMMLTEINTRGLQVLVLYQLISGLEKASIGHILDDFLRQRFGQNSYERVEYSAFPSKKQAAEKQAAVDRFNKKETGQFIFLLENRACSSTIKLSSLDVIVIYDSDWNPANDLRTLQKLSLDSEVEQIKVFRLYSSFTVEERALVLAKQDLDLDNNLQNSSRTARITSDTLSWGATHLFSKLDQCHADGTSSLALNSSGQLCLSEVTKEFQAILSGNADSNSVISKVKLGIGSYSTDVPVLGEATVRLKDGEEPHVFWRNLFQGKNSIWKNLNGPSPRNRKRIHYFEGSAGKATEGDDVAKKRKKMVDDSSDPALVQVDFGADQVSRVAVPNEEPSTIEACHRSENLQKDGISKNNPSGMSAHDSFGTGVSEGMSEERTISSDERKKLHKSLEREMMRLCQVLRFSEDVIDIVLRFLEYVIKHRDVNSDSQSVVQALQISLCWIAASITKTKIDKKDSLMSAKQLLNYQCTEEQAHSVYLILKEMYLQCPEKIVSSGRYCSLAEEGITKEKATASDRDNNIKKLHKKFKKRMKRLLRTHKEQLQDLHQKWDKERIKIETDHRLESVFIQSAYGQSAVGMDKLKLLDNDLAAKMEDLNLEKDVELKGLEAKQLSDIDEEKRKTAQWLALAKANSSQSGDINGPPQSLGPQSEKHVVESPQPSAPPADEAIGCETRVENPVTVNLRNEVRVSSSAVIEHVNQSKHSSDNEETVPANPVEERKASEKMSDKGCKSPSPDAFVNDRCEPNEAAGRGDLQSPRQQPPSLHSEQTTAVPDCSDLSPHQVQQDKTDQSLAPAKRQDLDQRTLENQITLEIETELINAVNPVPSDHEVAVSNQTVSPVPLTQAPATDETVNPVPSNHAAPVIENSQPSCNISPAIERNDQGRSSSPQTAEPRGTEVLSHESVPQSGENSDIYNDYVNAEPVCSVANGQSVELSGVPQNDVSAHQVVTGTAERPNQAVLSVGIDAGHVEGPSYLLHPTHRPASGSLHLSLLADPLQNELENLHRESEELEKYHKDMVSKLKSDCEKEIQEVIAQTRNKYEGKLQESEAEFRLKKNELDKNQNKVFKNKILAAAFRHKCSTPRPAPGVPSSFMQHMHQLSMPPSTRPPSCQSAPAQPIESPSLQTGQQLSRSYPARSPPIVNQNVVAPSVQAVQKTAALFSSTPPSRPPPLISTITPSCNSRPGCEIRSAAPHLQSFRPSVAVSPPRSTSLSVPQFQPMLQRLPSQPLQAPPPRGPPPLAPPLPSFTNLVVSHNRARPNNPSPSAPGLVVENERRPKDNRTLDLPEVCSTFGSLELSDLEILGNIEGNQASSVGTDVVCLSDDD